MRHKNSALCQAGQGDILSSHHLIPSQATPDPCRRHQQCSFIPASTGDSPWVGAGEFWEGNSVARGGPGDTGDMG